MTHFTSDNAAGIHPEVLEAIARVNVGSAVAYGHDEVTAQLVACIRGHVGDDAEVLPVWGGTAANVIALASVLEPWQAVLCADSAHIYVDECGAPQRFIGCTLVPIAVGHTHGKLSPDAVKSRIGRGRGVHHSQPRVLSVAQPTEVGTVYTPTELRALATLCHDNDLLLHVDGARLPMAAAALGCSLPAMTRDAGVDLLSLGGTKAGLMAAEAAVWLRPELARGAAFHRKQGMHLASKQRFVSAQLLALYEGDLWQRVAGHANAMARRLADAVSECSGVALVHPVETNGVFAAVPAAIVDALRNQYPFHIWNPDPVRPVVRWMTAWDTTSEQVDAFAAAIIAAVGSQSSSSFPRRPSRI